VNAARFDFAEVDEELGEQLVRDISSAMQARKRERHEFC